MYCRVSIDNQVFHFDWDEGVDISQSFGPEGANPRAFHLPQSVHKPVEVGEFIGSVKQGGSANCDIITFCAHGNGTHTECFGHVSPKQESINRFLPKGLFISQLITIKPEKVENDWVITKDLLEGKIEENIKAIIIRTDVEGIGIGTQWSGNNPPYFSPEALGYLSTLGIHHLLTDLPSVDREDDGGTLSAHKTWWNMDGEIRSVATITELVYVGRFIEDAKYILQIHVAPIESDAAPSRPIIFPIQD